MKAQVERCRASDMDKFVCVGLSLRTDDNKKRNLVQRKETVEYITTMVKFSLVDTTSGRLHVGQGSTPGPEAVARLLARVSEGEVEIGGGVTSRAPSKVDGMMQVAVKKSHQDSPRARHQH